MKMVKSLLLGSAAGLVAIAGAQAADLPVKAKPVEYVKICSIYGAGFFYIPGTDTCIKIGGWVRAEIDFNATGSHAHPTSGTTGRNNRVDTPDTVFRSRFVVSTDVRTQTEYGTLRAYTRAGFDLQTGEITNGRYYVERTFIQFAGFTAGRSQSYFDFMYGAYMYTGYIAGTGSSGANGTDLLAYTATLGNGFTATLSIEDGTGRRNAVWDSSTDTLSMGGFPGPSLLNSAVGTTPTTLQGDYAAHRVPDIVGSLRVDQAWGSAQIAAALHEVRTGWYGNNVTGLQLGAPETKWGFAILAGVNINLPWAKGDAFWVEGIYTQGALGYSGISQQNGQFGHFLRFNGANVVAGWGVDAIFGGTTALGVPIVGAPSSTELTTLWAINAALQHYWTPTLRTSIFGAYTEVDFNSTATTYFAGAGTVGPCRTLAGGVGSVLAPLPGCNPDFRVYGAGIRTIWNPAPQFDIGVEVVWTRVESKMDPNLVRLTFAGAGGRAPGLYTPSNSDDVFSAIFRMQRNFWP